MLSFKYALTKEDYGNYYTYVTWDASTNKRKRQLYYFNRILPLLIFVFAFYYTGLFERRSNFILIIGFALLATAVLSLMGVRTNTMRQAEKVADDPGNASIFSEQTITVSEAGITVRDEVKETRYQWKAIIRKLESQNYYFLFHNSIQAIIIPKRVLGSSDEKLQLERILALHLTLDAEVSHLLKT